MTEKLLKRVKTLSFQSILLRFGLASSVLYDVSFYNECYEWYNGTKKNIPWYFVPMKK